VVTWSPPQHGHSNKEQNDEKWWKMIINHRNQPLDSLDTHGYPWFINRLTVSPGVASLLSISALCKSFWYADSMASSVCSS
jgi:hypothetical protein